MGTPGAFDGAGGQHEHVSTYEIDIDHPAVLVGEDRGPTPVEYVLGALAGCLTAGVGNIASIRGVKLTKVTAHVTGKIDLNGIFGLSDARNGFQDIVVRFEIEGDAPSEQLRAVVEQSKARSAVFDIITNPTPVTVEIDA